MTAPPAGVYSRELPALDRHVQIGLAQGRVLSVEFPVEPDPEAVADPSHELLDRVLAYFEGTHEEFEDVTVALTMQTDHRAVLEAVRKLPYGESATVAQVARMATALDSEDEDAVRAALAGNPAPLFLPDHRVADGPSGAPATVVRACRALEGLSA